MRLSVLHCANTLTAALRVTESTLIKSRIPVEAAKSPKASVQTMLGLPSALETRVSSATKTIGWYPDMVIFPDMPADCASGLSTIFYCLRAAEATVAVTLLPSATCRKRFLGEDVKICKGRAILALQSRVTAR